MSIKQTTGSKIAAMGFAIALTATMAACSSDDSSTEATDSAAMTSTAMATSGTMADPVADLVGPGCAA
ncbi:MAG: fasciclin domain-containing protein, partial [Gordonia sp. (in: high G+C Gram-positive bacteria)]|nr:fasciclin domain-containing protein [Gordonia sp. (in: high G+C Gram-positive bacteria)]